MMRRWTCQAGGTEAPRRALHVVPVDSRCRRTAGSSSSKLRIAAIAAGLLAGLALVGGASALEVGQKAPDFTLLGPGGKQVKLSDLTAKGPVVLYTFIQAFTGT